MSGGARGLNPTSYVVLGLLALFGPATAYQLKQRVARSVGHFWNFSHSQVYGETARLVAAGYLTDDAEPGGRRRRPFTVTEQGRAAMVEWLLSPTRQWTEVRDPGLLKLFFWPLASGHQLVRLARDQELAHRQRADEYAAIRRRFGSALPWPQAKALELGERMEQVMIDFWHELDRESAR
jgi:DNA-binding PadR family transcriptional regulator